MKRNISLLLQSMATTATRPQCTATEHACSFLVREWLCRDGSISADQAQDHNALLQSMRVGSLCVSGFVEMATVAQSSVVKRLLQCSALPQNNILDLIVDALSEAATQKKTS